VPVGQCAGHDGEDQGADQPHDKGCADREERGSPEHEQHCAQAQPRRAGPQRGHAPDAADQGRAAQPCAQDAGRECGVVQAADGVGEAQLVLEEGRDRAETVDVIAVEGQQAVGQDGETVAAEGLGHESLLMLERVAFGF